MDKNFNKLIIGSMGETEFGWGPERIHDMFSRINFAYLQVKSIEHKDAALASKWEQMLHEVIKKNSHITEIEVDIENGYIDHQSTASEGENTQIFKSKTALKDFIFGKDSYIVLDNDNH
jgi:hypothetical protein